LTFVVELIVNGAVPVEAELVIATNVGLEDVFSPVIKF
jgi:hypothetical protein